MVKEYIAQFVSQVILKLEYTKYTDIAIAHVFLQYKLMYYCKENPYVFINVYVRRSIFILDTFDFEQIFHGQVEPNILRTYNANF